MTRLTDERIASLARQYLGTCKRVFYTKWKDGIDIEYPTLEVEQFARAIEAELSKQKPVARPRLPRIDHFAREAFEKFASGVECELTNYRWFEAGWDARGDTVAAAPLPSAPDTVQVPREPTQDMLYAMAELDGWKRGDREHPMLTRWEDYWVAALAAAPKSTP